MTLNHRALGHVVKRGLAFAPCAREQLAQRFANENGPSKLSTAETVLLLLTPLLFYLCYALVSMQSQFEVFAIKL